jgi:large subunit ribosomal protein L10
MKMNRTQKGAVVDRLTDQIRRAQTLYLTDFTGLAVKNITDLRRRLRQAGGEYVVVKNTLANRALSDAAIAGLEAHLAGPTAFVFAGEPVSAAKVLAEFQRDFEAFQIKAGRVEGRTVSAADVRKLATLPSREQLLSQLAGGFQAPMQGFLGAMNGLLYQWVGALEALRAQRTDAA